MDEENPLWLNRCAAELEEWPTTDMTGTYSVTSGFYSDSSCTTSTHLDDWTDVTSGDNCLVSTYDGNEVGNVIYCDGNEVYVDWFSNEEGA